MRASQGRARLARASHIPRVAPASRGWRPAARRRPPRPRRGPASSESCRRGGRRRTPQGRRPPASRGWCVRPPADDSRTAPPSSPWRSASCLPSAPGRKWRAVRILGGKFGQSPEQGQLIGGLFALTIEERLNLIDRLIRTRVPRARAFPPHGLDTRLPGKPDIGACLTTIVKLTPLSGRYLDFEEREQIALLKAEASPRDLARHVGSVGGGTDAAFVRGANEP